MQIHIIQTGYFKLDGGAMFGIVPKVLWNRLNPANENNLCNWAMRCLLLVDGNRRILIDTGIGEKQSEKFFGYYDLNGNESLELSLNAAGYEFADITDVLLTHLHFDHCGGAVRWNKDRTGYLPAFPNATYHLTEGHWNHANQPNPREKPSFLAENFMPLQEAGVLNFVKPGEYLTENIRCRVVGGHTIEMICPEISLPDKKIIYCADLIPSSHHIPLNYVMGYDIEPLKTMQEKSLLYQEVMSENALLFFEHDPVVACTSLQVNEKGQFRAGDAVTL
ncbi:MAG: MBL fold metallo-hydrolase [Bacteroidetes bacterium]|nr:MBL fold metallo-hydrolase [Bacteroidota bacterium]